MGKRYKDKSGRRGVLANMLYCAEQDRHAMIESLLSSVSHVHGTVEDKVAAMDSDDREYYNEVLSELRDFKTFRHYNGF